MQLFRDGTRCHHRSLDWQNLADAAQGVGTLFRYRIASAAPRLVARLLVALFFFNAPMSSAQDTSSQVASMLLEIDMVIKTSRDADIEISHVVEKYLSKIDDRAISAELAAHGFQLKPYKDADGGDIFSKYFRAGLIDPFYHEIRIAIKRAGGTRKFRGFIFYHAL